MLFGIIVGRGRQQHLKARSPHGPQTDGTHPDHTASDAACCRTAGVTHHRQASAAMQIICAPILPANCGPPAGTGGGAGGTGTSSSTSSGTSSGTVTGSNNGGTFVYSTAPGKQHPQLSEFPNIQHSIWKNLFFPFFGCLIELGTYLHLCLSVLKYNRTLS